MVRIRVATLSDASAFGEISGNDGLHNWSTLSAETSRCLLAENAQGHPVGFIEAHRAGDDIEIIMIATQPPARRQGIATHLLRALFAMAEDEDASRVILEVAEDNHPARQLYARNGFAEIARRPRYYRSHPNREPCDALLLARCFASAFS